MTAAAALTFDPSDPGLVQDPYPAYRRLRDHTPLYHDAERGFWALSRHEDVERASRDWRAFSNEATPEEHPVLGVIGAGDLLCLDPPRHDAIRRLMQQRFAPRAVAALEPEVRGRVRQLLAPLCERGHGDLAAELAWPLPVSLVLLILGLPQEDAPR